MLNYNPSYNNLLVNFVGDLFMSLPKDTTNDLPVLVERPPRIQPPFPEQTIEIPPPPQIQTRNQPLLQILLPLVTVAGYLLMSFTGASRNVLFVLPMSIAMFFSFFIAYSSRRAEVARQRALREAYDQRLARMRLDMRRWHDAQRRYYDYTYPASTALLAFHHEESHSRLGTRIWERRKNDSDFGMLRLGLGDVPSRVIYTLEGGGNGDENPQMDAARQLEIDSQTVTNAPILLRLRPDITDSKASPPRYSIGIIGKNPETVMEVITSLLVQYTAFHPNTEASLFIIGSKYAETRWRWADNLPHTNSKARSYKGDLMVFENPPILQDSTITPQNAKSSIDAFWEMLKKELDARTARLSERDSQGGAITPFLLVVVDMLPDATGNHPEWLDETPSINTVSTILADGARLGAGIIFLTTQGHKIPADCQAVIEVRGDKTDVTFRYSEIGVNTPRYVGTQDTITKEQATAFVAGAQK